MERTIENLVQYGLVKRSRNALWAVAAFIVEKNSPSKIRMKLDYRPFIKVTIQTVRISPHVESKLVHFTGRIVFSKMDFFNGYWQLPLHPTRITTKVLLSQK